MKRVSFNSIDVQAVGCEGRPSLPLRITAIARGAKEAVVMRSSSSQLDNILCVCLPTIRLPVSPVIHLYLDDLSQQALFADQHGGHREHSQVPPQTGNGPPRLFDNIHSYTSTGFLINQH